MHEVRIILSLPMSPSAFNDDKQTLFKASLAQAAGVSSEAVVIHRIEGVSSRRHLLADAIRVETGITTTDEAAAEAIADKLTPDSINRELTKVGLPAATVLLSVSEEEPGDIAVASSSSFFSTPVLVGGSLGLVIVLGIVVSFCHWKCKNRNTVTRTSSNEGTEAYDDVGARNFTHTVSMAPARQSVLQGDENWVFGIVVDPSLADLGVREDDGEAGGGGTMRREETDESFQETKGDDAVFPPMMEVHDHVLR